MADNKITRSAPSTSKGRRGIRADANANPFAQPRQVQRHRPRRRPSSAAVKVVYIAGAGRVGSTVLGNILGQLPGFTYAGEIAALSQRGIGENRLCGCGTHLRDCDLWRSTVEEAFGGMEQAQEQLRLPRVIQSERGRMPAMIPFRRRRILDDLKPYAESLGRLYRALGEAAGSRVIIDSSHLPLYGKILETAPGVEVNVVHLVRDPRGVAYSWLRKKVQPDPDKPFAMHRFNPAVMASLWTLANLSTEAFWGKRCKRYMRLRYEDLTDDPQTAIADIVRLTGKVPGKYPFSGQREVELAPCHSVFGNPDRFKTGTIKLRTDDAWRREMPSRSRAMVTSLTWPMMFKYGYLSRRPQAPTRVAAPPKPRRVSDAPEYREGFDSPKAPGSSSRRRRLRA